MRGFLWKGWFTNTGQILAHLYIVFIFHLLKANGSLSAIFCLLWFTLTTYMFKKMRENLWQWQKILTVFLKSLCVWGYAAKPGLMMWISLAYCSQYTWNVIKVSFHWLITAPLMKVLLLINRHPRYQPQCVNQEHQNKYSHKSSCNVNTMYKYAWLFIFRQTSLLRSSAFRLPYQLSGGG